MANKQQSKKRRVALARREESRRAAEAKRDRRRRLVVGGLTAFLALALIAPLTAGLLQGGSDDSAIDAATTTTFPELPWLPPAQAGAAIVGDTPCPATDGTETRTTEFETAPPRCIAADSTHELTFTTDAGEFTLPVDASLDPEAANLAITFGRYRTYEQIPVETGIEGLLWIGSEGDAGFGIPSEPVVAQDPYPVGSVVMVADITGRLWGTLAVVLDEGGSALLGLDPRHAVIGTVPDVDALTALENAVVTAVTATETS